MKILLVEDDPKISLFVKMGLEDMDNNISVAYDSAMAEKLIFTKEFDIFILDVLIPGITGFELCKKIRNSGIKTPVIMLTSLDSEEDKLKGFDCGADDYLVKPFSFKELYARLNVLDKRHTPSVVNPILTIADLTLDTITKKTKRNNISIKLSSKEFAILELLMSNQGKVFERVEIAEKIWGFSFHTGTNVIDVHINYLRKKIDKNFEPKLIQTIVGFGYVIKVPA